MSAAAGAWGFAGDVFTSIMGYRAQRKYLNWLKQFYGPDLEAKRAALPALRNLVLGYYLPQVGKQSELLKSQHLLSLAGLARQEGRALRGSERYWGLRGNTGRGRGEQLRIRMAAEQARNLESLGYGQSQEQYLSGKAAEALSGLQLLASLGQAGNPYAMQFAKLGMGAGAGFWGDMGLALQQLLGLMGSAAPSRTVAESSLAPIPAYSPSGGDGGPFVSGPQTMTPPNP